MNELDPTSTVMIHSFHMFISVIYSSITGTQNSCKSPVTLNNWLQPQKLSQPDWTTERPQKQLYWYLIGVINDASDFLAMALKNGNNLLSILVEDNRILVISAYTHKLSALGIMPLSKIY